VNSTTWPQLVPATALQPRSVGAGAERPQPEVEHQVPSRTNCSSMWPSTGWPRRRANQPFRPGRAPRPPAFNRARPAAQQESLFRLVGSSPAGRKAVGPGSTTSYWPVDRIHQRAGGGRTDTTGPETDRRLSKPTTRSGVGPSSVPDCAAQVAGPHGRGQRLRIVLPVRRVADSRTTRRTNRRSGHF